MKIGFFIGRFQPAHKGHLQALLDMHATGINHIVIGIGSAQKEWTEENPFTYLERKRILELLLGKQPFTYEIYAVPDVGDDEQWFQFVTTNLPHFDVVLSGNPRLESIFKPKGYEMYLPTITVAIKGTNTRKAIALKDTSYLDQAINTDVYNYLLEIDAPKRLQGLMPGLGSYKVTYICILDTGEKITLPGVPYMSAHNQIVEYCKNEKNIHISILNTPTVWEEIINTESNTYNIILTFSGKTINK